MLVYVCMHFPPLELGVKHLPALLNLAVRAALWWKGVLLWYQFSSCQAQIPASWRPCPVAGTGLLPPRTLPRSAVGLPQGGILQRAGHPHPCLLRTLTSVKSPDVRCVSTGKKWVKMAGILSPQPPALHLMSRQLYPVKTNSFFLSRKCFFHVWPLTISFRITWYTCTFLAPTQACWILLLG